MRWIAVFRVLIIGATLITTWYFAESIFSTFWQLKNVRSVFGSNKDFEQEVKAPHNKCGNEKSCPDFYFAFKIISGAANVVGPSICFEDQIVMSGVKNNIGPGINIAFVNEEQKSLLPSKCYTWWPRDWETASNGIVENKAFFNMYSGDVKPLIKLLESISEGTLLLIASYDDPATKLDAKARELLTSYGSNFAKKLAFRDSWVFVGAKGLKDKSPFEQHLKNEKVNNKYDGWPEVLEMEGCIPRKLT
uniref:FAM3 metabolism regulating signaling molecule D n=1 Tax=Leptobrachium leishanense TaxID=445787 RepID=A0A8C5QFW0_9ANUR